MNFIGVEVWKPIVGWEGIYEVSNRGRVRSLDRFIPYRGQSKRFMRGRVLSGWIHFYGHPHVDLRQAGKHRKVAVHTLVLETFVGPCPKGMEACHENGIHTDNRVENLRWGTRASNIQDMLKHGVHGCVGSKAVNSVLTDSVVLKIRKSFNGTTEQIFEFSKKFKADHATIIDVLKHKTWKHVSGRCFRFVRYGLWEQVVR